jgi:hypothetical protein
VRAYVVVRGAALYAYSGYEVRLPCWDDGNSNEASTCPQGATALAAALQPKHPCPADAPPAAAADPLAHEGELCGGGGARPYNRHRCKPRTERLTLGARPHNALARARV